MSFDKNKYLLCVKYVNYGMKGSFLIIPYLPILVKETSILVIKQDGGA